VRTLFSLAILSTVPIGCSQGAPESASSNQPQAEAQAAKGGTAGLATEAPAMTQPPGAPTADQVVGSKAGGGN
jgi:hypothetical protein